MERTPSVFVKLIVASCLCLGAASGLGAQAINYTIQGSLGSKPLSGKDPLVLAGSPYTVTTSLPAVGKPFQTGSETYTGLNVSITATSAILGQPDTFTCSGATAVVTASSGGDSIVLSNCNIATALGAGSFAATANFPGNSFVSPIPLAFNAGMSSSSTATYVFNNETTVFGITGSTAAVCSGCPALSLTPSPVVLTGQTGGSAVTQSVSVSTGGTALAYADFVTSGSWLSVSVAGGQTGGSFTVTATPGSMAAGTYNGTITVYTAASNSPLVLPVTLNVGSATFNLVATPASFIFNSVTGANTPTQPLAVTSSSGSSVAYTASASSTGNWLSVSPTSGTTGGSSLTVSVNPAAVAGGGSYSGTITLTAAGATNSPLTVPVTLNVTTVAVSPTSLTYNFTTGGAAPPAQPVNVTSTGPTVSYSASVSTTSGGTWLSVSPTSGTTNGPALSVSVIPGVLAAGTYNGTVNITPAGASAPIPLPVTFTVAIPTLTVLPTSLTFPLTSLGTLPQSQSIAISVSNGAAFPFTATASTVSGGSWLAVSPVNGTTPGSVNVSIILNNLAAGPYTGSVTITAPGTAGSKVIPVQLNVTAAPVISGNPPSLLFAYTLLSANPASQTTSITASGGAAIPFTAVASGGSWLSVTSNGVNTPATLTVTVNPSGLTPAVYNGTITLTSAQASNNGQTIPVTFTVTAAPTISASVQSQTYAFQIGGANPAAQSFTVSSSSGAALPFTAAATTTSGGNWLSVAPPNGNTPATLTATVNASGLAANTYTGSISITAVGASNSINIPVTLTVSSQDLLTTAPSALTFNFTVGGTVPGSQTVSVGSTGASLSYTATTVTPWLTVTQTGSTTPGSLTVSVNTVGLTTAGTQNGTITITPAGGTALLYPVTLIVAGQPSLSVGPAALTFGGQTGGANPASQTISVASTAGTLNFTASAAVTSGGSWLSVAPPGGTTNGTLTASVNTAGMAAGTYKGTITVAAIGAANTPVTVPVVLTLSSTVLTVTPTPLAFSYQIAGAVPASQTVTVGSTGAALSFQATAGAPWLSVAPTSGTTLATLSVSINAAGLTAGTYTSAVNITAAGAANSPLMVPVTFTVTPQGGIVAAPNTLAFSYTTGASAPASKTVTLSTSNGTVASFSATAATTSGGNWLAVSPASGATPGSLMISVVPAGLAAGTYAGSVTISATGFTSQTVSVTLTVTAAAPASIAITGNAAFTVTNTTVPASTTLTIALSTGSALAYTVSAVAPQPTWLSFTPSSGTTPGGLTLTANAAGLYPGTYLAGLVVTVPGITQATKTISVQLTVAGSSLTANPAVLTFAYPGVGSAPPAQSLTITPGQGGAATISLGAITTSATWLRVTSAAAAPATLQVSVSPSLLAAGSYNASIFVTALGSTGPSLVVPVSLTVGPLPQLTASPAALVFGYTPGGALPAAQSFAVASGGTALNFTVTSPGAWLTVSPTKGTTPASVLVTANPTGLGAGTYTGTITASASGATPASVSVTLTVSGPGQLQATPTQLTFAAPPAGPAPASQTVSVNAVSAISFTAVSSAKWLAVTPASGTTPAALTISANPAGMLAGTYLGSITLTPTSGSGAPVIVSVTFTVGSGTGTGTPTISAVTNAASGAAGTVAPGLWVSIFGTSLGPVTGVSYVTPPTGETVATTLGGTQVLFDNTAVPLLYVSDAQINALVPFELVGKTSTVMQVVSNGQVSANLTLPVVAAWPGLFTADHSGKGEGAILNQDASVNSTSNPAAQGSVIVLYGSGGGQTNPASIDGGFNPLTADGILLLPVTVTIGGQTAVVNYAGPAPSLVDGVMQINAVLPSGLASGAVSVVVKVGTADSQTITVAVQ